jgi:tetratricopeptide (TPR) repeat protein
MMRNRRQSIPRSTRAVLLAALLLPAAGLLATACGDGDHPTTTPTPGGDGTGTGDGTGPGTDPGGDSQTGIPPAGGGDSGFQQGIDAALAQGGSGVAGVEIVPLTPTQAEDFRRAVEALEVRGDESAAQAGFSAVLSANPTAYRAAYNLGYLAERAGDAPTAILNYRRALDIKPDYPNALRALFRLLTRAGRAADALTQVRDRADAFPANDELQAILAEAYIEADRFDEGILVARRLLLADANNLQAFLILLKAAIRQERSALILELLKRISDGLVGPEHATYEDCTNPTVPVPAERRGDCKLWGFLYYTQAQIAARDGRRFEATALYERAILADPTFVEARVLLARFQLDVGRLNDAMQNLDAARMLAPTWLPVLVGLGNAHRGLGDLRMAMEYLRKAEELYGNAPEVHVGIGLVYFDGRLSEFEGLARADADQKAMESYRRAQALLGGGNDTEIVALIASAQTDYDIVTAPPPAAVTLGDDGDDGWDTGGSDDGWDTEEPAGGTEGAAGGTEGAAGGTEGAGGGDDDGWGGGW